MHVTFTRGIKNKRYRIIVQVIYSILHVSRTSLNNRSRRCKYRFIQCNNDIRTTGRFTLFGLVGAAKHKGQLADLFAGRYPVPRTYIGRNSKFPLVRTQRSKLIFGTVVTPGRRIFPITSAGTEVGNNTGMCIHISGIAHQPFIALRGIKDNVYCP